MKVAERLLKRGRVSGAARVIRSATLEAEKADERETLYALRVLVEEARPRLNADERRTFDAILSGAEERPVHVGPLEAGLVLVGATGIIIGVFLPMADPESFARVTENTLIQNGWGWAFLGLAASALVDLLRVRGTGARSAVIPISGLLAAGLAVYVGMNDELMTLCPTDTGIFVPDCEQASPGLGVYATGIGGLLLVLGGWLLASVRPPSTSPAGDVGQAPATKTCPDCAETVLAAANVCKHCGYRFSASEPSAPDTPTSP